MKKIGVLLVVAGFLINTRTIFSQNTISGAEMLRPRHRISLEVYGGLSLANPGDFNFLTATEEQLIDYNYSKSYAYLNSLYGNSYTYSRQGNITDAFHQIKILWPMGFRLLYPLNRTFSFSAGLQFMTGSRTSDVNVAYQINDTRKDQVDFPNSFVTEISYPELSLLAQGWSPQAGIHAGFQLSRGLRMEGFLTGGPYFASCRNAQKKRIKTTYENKWRQESVYSHELKGTGTGIALECGGRLKINLFKRTQVFLEGGYAYRRVNKISGPIHSESQIADTNAAQDNLITDYEGTWKVREVTTKNTWGTWNFNYVSPLYSLYDPGTPGIRDFKLDLSGFEFKIGLSWTL